MRLGTAAEEASGLCRGLGGGEETTKLGEDDVGALDPDEVVGGGWLRVRRGRKARSEGSGKVGEERMEQEAGVAVMMCGPCGD